MATKRRQRFTKWRISDVMDALVLDIGGDAEVHIYGGVKRCPACASKMAEHARSYDGKIDPIAVIRSRNVFAAHAVGMGTALYGVGPRPRINHKIAAAIVAEARRLNVPKRAR